LEAGRSTESTFFGLDRQILQNNLYGVDLNAQAIQICELSLWIKTAARDKQLTSLDRTTPGGCKNPRERGSGAKEAHFLTTEAMRASLGRLLRVIDPP
jgi:hypothetical protein